MSLDTIESYKHLHIKRILKKRLIGSWMTTNNSVCRVKIILWFSFESVLLQLENV